MVAGKVGDDEMFVATNVTKLPKHILNGTLSVAISDSEECTPDAYNEALKFPLVVPLTYFINALGEIEGEGGWSQQRIRELQSNSTLLPISLAELINGDESEHGDLAVYLLSSDEDEELLGCGFLKKHDEDKAAEYDELLNGLFQEAAVEEDPSSGSKIGLFVSVFATIAAVRIAAMLGDVLAL